MEVLDIHKSIRIDGDIQVPGDKSISHRAVILGSIANGITRIENFLDGEDCMRTVEAFRLLGVSITKENNCLEIHGNGKNALQEPSEPIYFGNSGTTARLMLGLLAGLSFSTVVYGDKSLSSRPMDRVLKPLKAMGVQSIGRKEAGYLPLALRGGDLHGITYEMPVNSAQVKSALLLAGLGATGVTKVIERYRTRNHTENMLKAFGANISVNGKEIEIDSSRSLSATDVFVPGDISSAAFLLSAAAIIPESSLMIRNVGINDTRAGFLDVLIQMGSKIEVTNKKTISGEPIGDIKITNAPLSGIIIEGDLVPRLIDEIPIIALLATQAEGKTIIRDAEELRVKETDRIQAIVDVLSRLGANIEATDDGMIIEGKTSLNGGEVRSYDDHRIAMMVVVASLISEDHVIIDDLSSISISYPGFMNDLQTLVGK
ncbi:3-phosphoshikimate 1-carboxyvinyltransferase [Ornithinibacillus californiensis]|uniref:3-phosphoshikimate 1-carboxyvinyltransferase n=1 Tax=Ornithinibacillus californiensis TaxID=161536 RepID=UPI00064D9777|nr:3-phosphoshikimate 1-carboxyvinyltransferase [Ornithinibacillus californiensis]